MARYRDSFEELVGFSLSMDRMLSSILLHEQGQPPTMWRPPTDVYETHDDVVILLEIAGMDPNKIQVEFRDRVLRISGRRSDRQPRAACHCLEVQYGDFASEVYLPGEYNVDAINATYENGFLTITLPKIKTHAKVIAVQSNATE
jgi:HSP20 family molecular chaperone IbpA